jgi:hypothetical protein
MAIGADRKRLALAATTAMVTILIAFAATAQNRPKPPKSARLYVFRLRFLDGRADVFGLRTRWPV